MLFHRDNLLVMCVLITFYTVRFILLFQSELVPLKNNYKKQQSQACSLKMCYEKPNKQQYTKTKENSKYMSLSKQPNSISPRHFCDTKKNVIQK